MSDHAAARFQPQSPARIYKDAHRFSKTLGRFVEMPQSMSKSRHVKNLAQDGKEDVRYALEQSKYQNELYRRLEQEDQRNRRTLRDKISERAAKNTHNVEQLKKQSEKVFERQNKHLQEVQKKYEEKERSQKLEKQEQALKLRKSLLEFHEKQEQRRKQAQTKQVNVNSCYEEAMSRLEKIQQKNQQHALKSEREVYNRLRRNSLKERNVMERSRLKSAENKRKQKNYELNCEILQQKQQRNIEKYCQDLESSIKAFQHKQKSAQKTKERIQKFFKQRVQRWQSLKKRVDQEKSQVSDRCVNLLDKSTKAMFRNTMSSFRDTGKSWHSKVQQNRTVIHEKETSRREEIIKDHLDLRLRNNSSFKVEEQMGSMRAKAKKLGADFL